MEFENQPNEQWDAQTMKQQNYSFIFMVVGSVTLIPLAIIATAVAVRKGVPPACRFLSLCITVTLFALVTAMLIAHFVLGPQDFKLARGDQIVIGRASEGHLISADEFRSIACNKLTIQTMKPGVAVWAISVSLNRGEAINYSLTLNNWVLPAYTRLQLGPGDLVTVRNLTTPIRVVWLKGHKAWNEWILLKTQRLGYEKCCAWKDMEESQLEIDNWDEYTAIFRPDSSYNIENRNNFTAIIDLQRTRWVPTPCDPIICNGVATVCETDNAPSRYVIEYSVHAHSAPPYEMNEVRIVCDLRHWVIGLMLGAPSAFIILLTATIWKLQWTRSKIHIDEHRLSGPKLQEKSKNEGSGMNPAFELDIV